MTSLLAFDTATERMAIGVMHDGRVWTRDAEGGVKASAALIPTVLALLGEAGIGLSALDAIAFGRGPGAFTGLRTACAVAQGLAFGAGKPVLAIDTLLIVAEDVRGLDDPAGAAVWAVTDARMNQIYAACYRHDGERWTTLQAPMLTDCAALAGRWGASPPQTVAGNALLAFGDRLATGPARRVEAAAPRAAPLLRLAEQAWRDGAVIDPARALPLYVRDKVAETTSERADARAAAQR